jgi:hypothetical protein
VITSVREPFCDQSLEEVSGITRSMLVGSAFGALLIPALFPVWVVLHVDDDLVNCGNGFGTRKKDIDHFLVILLFAIWLAGVIFGYTSSGAPGAVSASVCVGSIAGAFLGFWVQQRKFS